MATKSEVVNPKTTHFEFFGPIGTFFLIFLLPATVLSLGLLVDSPIYPYSLNRLPSLIVEQMSAVRATHVFFYLSWMAFQVFLYYFVPGKIVDGTVLRTGEKLKYKVNAFRVLITTHAVMQLITAIYGSRPLIWVADNFFQISVVASFFSIKQSFFLWFLSSRRPEPLLSTIGNSGNFFYDFWMGRELNPRIIGLDLKYFCELRPGMFLWAVLNWAHVAKQYHEFGFVTNSMIVVVCCQLIYIADSVYYEQAILTTMDITTDGFGFMLTYGDLVWVPFTFSLQSKYLASNPIKLPRSLSTGLLFLNIWAYYVFRSSNSQKNLFRSQPDHPSVKNLKYIKTETGSRLLIDGWWKMSRHMNYFGDWMMGLSWCLCTGFPSINNALAYFYVLYFGFLLVHRALRDDHKCRLKYGKDWEKYCNIVKYRIIPYVY